MAGEWFALCPFAMILPQKNGFKVNFQNLLNRTSPTFAVEKFTAETRRRREILQNDKNAASPRLCG